jgi:stage IV sporulation protein FB
VFGPAYKIAAVFGIPIRLHWSLFLILPFIHAQVPGGVLMTLGLTVGILASIALHELGHSLVAVRTGTRVREIVLTPIGGVALMKQMPTRPRHELMMAAAGPAVSFVLANLLLLIVALLPSAAPPKLLFGLGVLGIANIGLGLFNLLPSFPMDGGRILRAMMAPRLGRVRATRVAMKIGRVFAVLIGLFGLAHRRISLVFIAAVVFILAGVEYRTVRLQEAARRFGFPMPGFLDDEEEDGEDTVIIGPPPFEKGKKSKTRIHHLDR